MIRPFTSAALLAVSTSLLWADASNLTRLLPSDTDLVVVVNDLAQLRSSTEDSPVMRAWRDPEIAAWLAPLRERFDWDEFNETARAKAGASPEEVAGWIQGGVVLAVRDFSSMMPTEGKAEPAFVVAAEFGSNADKMNDFLEAMAERRADEHNLQHDTETYAGATVHSLYPQEADEPEAADEEEAMDEENGEEEAPAEQEPMVWAMSDGLLIISANKAEVLALLDAQQDGGAENPLSNSPRFQQLRSSSHGELAVALRLPRLVELMQNAMAAGMQANQNPMIPQASAVVQGLGLDAWEQLWFTWGQDGEEFVGEYGLDFRDARGLLGLLQHSGGAFPQPEWVPAHWRNVASYRFDVGELVPRLLQIVSTISPPVGGMAQGMLAQTGQKMGIDLQRDLMGRFGDEVIVVQRFEAVEANSENALMAMNQVPTLVAVSIEDRAGFEKALETLWSSGGPAVAQVLKTREYLGFKLSTFTPPPPAPDAPPGAGGQPFHYAITDSYAFFATGAATPVEEALQSLARGGDSFWDRDDVREAVKWAPTNASMFQIQDMASLFELIVPAMSAAMEMASSSDDDESDEDGEPDGEENGAWVDPEAAPSPGVFRKYFGDSWSVVVQDQTSLRATVRVRAPNP